MIFSYLIKKESLGIDYNTPKIFFTHLTRGVCHEKCVGQDGQVLRFSALPRRSLSLRGKSAYLLLQAVSSLRTVFLRFLRPLCCCWGGFAGSIRILYRRGVGLETFSKKETSDQPMILPVLAVSTNQPTIAALHERRSFFFSFKY